ncbi:MAG: aconitate hydratase [Cyanobacteria bacterium HKST-UBA03]|nr:aconitate hydratase [Cyanobacteria bacterium HKST-UBA03]
MPTLQESKPVDYKAFYSALPDRIAQAKEALGKSALTLAEKILFAHTFPGRFEADAQRGKTILALRPDRVAMQDATAQMAMLQFMQSGRSQAAVASTVHCDHLIRAQSGAKEDMERAIRDNEEVYNFLRTASAKYGIGFWKPGSGIIHQVVLEKYAFPGGLMIGTDSHTPNAGGLGMIAIGVGGADAAETMAGLPWEVLYPKLVGVKLTGKMSGWTASKDVILKLLDQLTTKGGTNRIIEYFGDGTASFSTTGKGTITNMGAELGATTSIFPFDDKMADYLRSTGRPDVAEAAMAVKAHLQADAEVLANPTQYYDEVIEINLSELEPHIVGPHSPDRARPISAFAAEIEREGFPDAPSATLIGSCTNSSYEDIERVASIARAAQASDIKAKVPLLITPGSDQVLKTIERDGQLEVLNQVGGTVLANACGPCIGNWDRQDIEMGQTNAIITSFNRNFPKRNDGNPETLAFISSPEIVMAYALAGTFKFNPLTDAINGVKLPEPTAPELPAEGFVYSDNGYEAAPADGSGVKVEVKDDSTRLKLLNPFPAWNGADYTGLYVLLKTQGQTTTDHISPAGKDWLPLRGHLPGISYNMCRGAVDADTGEVAPGIDMEICGRQRSASPWALKALEMRDGPDFKGLVIVGDENYGEGSSREHAAMSPRLLGVKVVIARSFARIHETNLKKQGILPLVFSQSGDYSLIKKGDALDVVDLANLVPGKPVTAYVVNHQGERTELKLNHSLTAEQIGWFKAGSAMNAANQN